MNRIVFIIAITTFLIVVTIGCKRGKTEPPKAIPAVHLSKTVAEGDLATVTLTPEAEQRLGIVTTPVTRQKVERTRSYGGELLLPLGKSTGTNDGNAGKSLYSLMPATTLTELARAAEMQVDADGQVAAARVQLEAARVAHKRAEELVTSKAGAGRAVDDARVQVQLAEAALQTAQARRGLLGAPVFDAVKLPVLWVRVPVYVGDLPDLNTEAPARLSNLGGPTNGWQRQAKPVPVPITGTTTPAMTDLFYEVANEGGLLRPGQKIAALLPLLGQEESLVVPPDSILYDIHGNTWVYENTAPHTFVRRRVEVRYTADVGAVLGRGPPVGAKVVGAGAAELFGTEFGPGK